LWSWARTGCSPPKPTTPCGTSLSPFHCTVIARLLPLPPVPLPPPHHHATGNLTNELRTRIAAQVALRPCLSVSVCARACVFFVNAGLQGGLVSPLVEAEVCHIVACCFSSAFASSQPWPHAAAAGSSARSSASAENMRPCQGAAQQWQSRHRYAAGVCICHRPQIQPCDCCPAPLHQALQQVGWSPRDSIEAAAMAVQVSCSCSLNAPPAKSFPAQ
jgi:hypothetical protein